jgi:transcriptional regulator with XRE-family HTH domain
MKGHHLIREARRRSGLTQRELGERAGTTQSAVARWESGRTSPDLATVHRLVRLCGLDLEVALVEPDDSDLAQARRLQDLTPAQRLERGVAVARGMHELKNARRARA